MGFYMYILYFLLVFIYLNLHFLYDQIVMRNWKFILIIAQ